MSRSKLGQEFCSVAESLLESYSSMPSFMKVALFWSISRRATLGVVKLFPRPRVGGRTSPMLRSGDGRCLAIVWRSDGETWRQSSLPWGPHLYDADHSPAIEIRSVSEPTVQFRRLAEQ